MRSVSAAAVALIKHYEGLALEARLSPADAWTIGWGHRGGTPKTGAVHAGMRITEGEAELLLQNDLTAISESLERLIYPESLSRLTEGMYGALVSFVHSEGLAVFCDSTLRARVNARRWLECLPEFPKFTAPGGRVLRSLARRRAAEQALFCSFPA